MKLLILSLAVVALTAPALAPQKAGDMDGKIRQLIKNLPKATEMTIEYREIKSLAGQYQWHIGDTHWWVRLHSAGHDYMKDLDKGKKYKVTGIVVDQNFGVIEVWLQTLSPIEPK